MRASTAAFVQTTRTVPLFISISSRFKARLTHSPASSVLLLSLGFLISCATKTAYMGHDATDLSSVKAGELRATIELTIGEPEKVEQRDSVVMAWYVVDRGFVGTLEENSVGEKIVWAPLMAWGELVSLGLVGWMVACSTPCQKGWLVIVYDNKGRVSSASEDFLPDEHPLVAECARSAVRADIGVCQGVRERVRPSSLPSMGMISGNSKPAQ